MAGKGQRLILFVLFVGTMLGVNGKGVIRGGFYKVESLSDHSVLTTTWNGQPRQVITDEWAETGTQEWRVRSTINNGEVLHILRNEFVKDNEVNKEPVPGTEGLGKNGRAELVVSEWTFSPVQGKEHTFTLQTSRGCLQNNGRGTRISYAGCNPSALNQQWNFEFLFEKQE